MNDNNIQVYYLLNLIIRSNLGLGRFDYINQIITTLTVVSFRGFHCNNQMIAISMNSITRLKRKKKFYSLLNVAAILRSNRILDKCVLIFLGYHHA
jgi:hypothetical protein